MILDAAPWDGGKHMCALPLQATAFFAEPHSRHGSASLRSGIRQLTETTGMVPWKTLLHHFAD